MKCTLPKREIPFLDSGGVEVFSRYLYLLVLVILAKAHLSARFSYQLLSGLALVA